MDALFHFNFYERNQNGVQLLRSLVFGVGNISATHTWEEIDQAITLHAEDVNAKHGQPFDVRLALGENVFRYVYSNVDGRNQDKLLQLWRATVLTAVPDCVLGDVFDATHMPIQREVFVHAKEAYEQQQAQHLRATLSANITTCASTAAAKKI